ncbi:hypothetical protein BPAE_0014g00380 [Botrytis paeoniae]|uniref:Uncharacterized protein n=1 Tax=Botrytis paeoniae TaxID=278948 RepID=A0A4Z1G616_9HELO|nr:hypothetical protein BPAE_0014g00380 [Botrytis paeoniae]
MRGQRKKDYKRQNDWLREAKKGDKGIEVVSEDLKKVQCNIESLDLKIAAKTRNITENEEKYDIEVYGERSANGKKSKAVNNSSKGSKDQGVGLRISEK